MYGDVHVMITSCLVFFNFPFVARSEINKFKKEESEKKINFIIIEMGHALYTEDGV